VLHKVSIYPFYGMIAYLTFIIQKLGFYLAP
jgi:hypothetical protein